MGGGASSPSLSSAEKALLYQYVESRYVNETEKEEQLGDSTIDDTREREIRLFRSLVNAYEEGLEKCKSTINNNNNTTTTNRNTNTTTYNNRDATSDNEVMGILKPSVNSDTSNKSSTTPTSSPSPSNSSFKFISPKRSMSNKTAIENSNFMPLVDVILHPHFDIDSDFEYSDAKKNLLDLKPSIDLLNSQNLAAGRSPQSSSPLSSAAAVHSMSNSSIESFVSKMISGAISSNESTDFRSRRLTYSVRTGPNVSEAGLSSSYINNNNSEKKLTRKRTSIFSSSEIGYVQEKSSPFPPDSFGTYSCHGIEPSCDGSETKAKINQDRGCCCYPFNSSYEQALFLVLDGHGECGDQISEFTMRQLVVSLEKHPKLADSPVIALRESVVETHAAIITTDIECMTSGCTLVAIYMVGSKLYIANVGDSRAVLASATLGGVNPSGLFTYTAKDLTHDHKPDDPVEMARIKAAGGFIRPSPEVGLSARVYLDEKLTMIGLAMSRSIGDFAVKNIGVTAEPEIFEYHLEPEDAFIVLASDGVWEFMTSQEVVDIVSESIQCTEAEWAQNNNQNQNQNHIEGGGEGSAAPKAKKDSALVACQNLIQVAATIWQDIEGDYRDDITAIIIRLPLFNRAGVKKIVSTSSSLGSDSS